MKEGWRQFRRSGFFFRFENGKCVQGVVIASLPDDEDTPGWRMISKNSANKYLTTKDFWFKPDRKMLKDLNKIPENMIGTELFSWAVDLAAEN